MNEVFWCVKERDSLDAVNDPWGFNPWTVRRTRSDSIVALEQNIRARVYSDLRRRGLARCVKVTIQEVESETR